jgi:transcription-repair coupling factor (superfamily II helicase)
VTIESDLELRLPPEYVPQENERIMLYRELDNMERPEQIEEFREHLRDRFGAIPTVSEELINVVPLRMSAKRLGIERIVLKNGEMRIYFVGDDNKAYYSSPAFCMVMDYAQNHFRTTHLKNSAGHNLMIVDTIPTVTAALAVLREIEKSSRS